MTGRIYHSKLEEERVESLFSDDDPMPDIEKLLNERGHDPSREHHYSLATRGNSNTRPIRVRH